MGAVETFIVRIWRPTAGPSEAVRGAGMRGFVEHATSGRRQRFMGATELLDLLTEDLDTQGSQLLRVDADDALESGIG
jgi:hypothetical protein